MLDVVNPARGTVFESLPEAGEAHLEAAVGRAERALSGWRHDDAARGQALVSAGKALLAAQDELAPVLVAEQGKPLAQAVDEIRGTAGWMLYYGRLEVPREVVQDDDRAHVEVRRVPLGVTAAVTPWNFPLMLAAFKLAPALRAGNTVLLKPSPYTPVSSLRMAELLTDVLPEGVLQVLVGGNDLGRLLVSHPRVRKVSFTGSIQTGKAIAAAAAPDLKRLTLELGGNDAAVVLDDADVGTVAGAIYDTAFLNAGQVCCAIKRVYAPRRLHNELVDALAARASSTKVGDGSDPETEMGPLNNRPQLDRVTALVKQAVADGAQVAAGGAPLGGAGYFHAPTVLAGVPDATALVQEEQFGPALPVVPYDDLEEAVAMANGTPYGLCGSVWGTDTERARGVAARLECGTAWVNTHLAIAPHVPFSGFKHSGVGVENGLRGLEAFTQLQVLHTAR